MSQSGIYVRSHWHHRCEGITVPVDPFYQLVMERLAQKQIPDARIEKVLWREGGIISPAREYLRIGLGKHIFDVCTAPFGNGTFFSCWSAEKKPSGIWGLLALILLVGLGFVTFVGSFLIPVIGFIFWAFCALAVVIALPFLIMMLPVHLQEYVWATPKIGPFLEGLLATVTYYKIDTGLMAEQAIYEAVQEAVGAVSQAQGYRALTADERRPFMKELI